MENYIGNYWELKFASLKKSLQFNGFEVYIAKNREEAKNLALDKIIPGMGAKTISWGGSMTFVSSGLYEAIKNNPEFTVLDTYDKKASTAEILQRRRQALLSDLFITGANAVTETGKLVNLDMFGNRTAAITFGPSNVLILAGKNKVVPTVEEAQKHIKNYTAPVNAMRLDKKTPCVETGICHDCNSPGRICNHLCITEKSYPKGRIKIMLIDEDLGI